MSKHQRTSTTVKPVSAGLAKQVGRMVEDAARTFSGGLAVLERAKGNPDFKNSLHRLFNALGNPKASILELVGTTSLPDLPAFDASRMFVTENQPDGIRFWLGDNFRTHFCTMREGPVPATQLRRHELMGSAVDLAIIAELGEEAVETFLSQFYEMIRRQANGEQGDLRTDGRANICYIRDAQGNLWAVRCRWDAGGRGWCVGAGSVSSQYGWDAGFRVFSRDSSAT